MARPTVKMKGTLLLDDDSRSVARAAAIIRQGGLVAFPTETVYGLGAAATDPGAVKKIFAAKGRPYDNPLIVHLSGIEQLSAVALNVPEAAFTLVEKFWPGPLSLVLFRSKKIPPEVSAGLPTVAVRMPDHPVALNLIEAAGVPVAAPSANRSGLPSPTDYRHVLKDLAGFIDAVIKSDVCEIGVESTVLDLTGPAPVILRPGGLSREKLEEALGRTVGLAALTGAGDKPLSPGMKYRHYSPLAPMILVVGPLKRRRPLLKALVRSFKRKGLKVGLLNISLQHHLIRNSDPGHLAARLYGTLRRLDAEGVDLILAEETETAGLGLAVMNRLRRAATRVIKT